MGARIRLCGRLEVELSGERVEGRLPGRQGPLVVALLVLGRARPVGRDELIDALWPEELPADPQESLSALLSKVRRAVGSDVLTGRRELTLTLPEDTEVDFEEALAASERSQAALAGGGWEAAWEAASVAAEIAGRGFLAGHDGAWVDDRRRELEEVRLRALETLAEAGLRAGGARLDGAERAARTLVRSAPLRESGHRLLMEALAVRGELAEALAAYEALRVLLRDELGTAPGEAVRALHERLLAGDTPRKRPEAEPAPAESAPLPAALARPERGPFVAREPELERLRAAWAAARGGRRGLVVLCGGPGIGKTRLASELARTAHADGTVLYGACQEDALVAYQPFVEALRHHVRTAPAAASAGTLGPGAAELASLIPELAERAAGAPPAPEDPETRRYLMFEAVAALLAEAAAHGPVLLVLDDLHWADTSTIQLLRHVVRAQEEPALLILGTYRDAEVHTGHPLAELLGDLRRDGLFERVSLDGLDRGGVGELIESHAGQAAPSALVQTVHSTTEGNPFFVEEVVRHLIESGAAFGPDGRAAASPGPGEVGVPEGVKEVLALRLARLSERCREVLASAAVLGREFRFEELAAMAGGDDEAVIEALEEALGARLVVEEPGQLDPSYTFVHALVRESLYEGLSGPRRQRMHALAARATEAASGADPDARLAALAVHHRLAGSAADPAKGIEYSMGAGDRARRLFAWDEAAAHWEGAAALMERAGTDPAARARLHVALAEVCHAGGDLARQQEHLGRALALYTALGDEERTAQLHSRLGIAHALIDSVHGEHLDVGRAFHHFDAARAVLHRGPARASRGHLETGVAWAWTYGLRIEPGIEAASRAMGIGEELGDELLWAGAAQAYAWHSVVAGNIAEAFATLERSFEVADRHRSSFQAWLALNTRGQMTWGLGAPREAREFLSRPLGLEYVGRTAYRQEIADGVGRCHASMGDMEEARRLLPDARAAWISHSLRPLVDLWDGSFDRVAALAEQVLAKGRRAGNRWDEWASHHLAARVLRLRGQLEPSAERLEQAIAIVAGGGATYFELWVRPDLARVRAEGGRLEEARGQVDRCREVLDGGEDWRGRRGIVELAEAVVLGAEGRAEEAGARFASALATLRRHELVPEQADCLHEWGRALVRAGDHAGAAEKLGAAEELYAAHGAGAAWLERVAADARAEVRR